jgi:hypothetical protein
MPSTDLAGAGFVREIPPLYRSASTTEETYYPLLRQLWSALLEERDLPFEVRTGTSEKRQTAPGTDRPDLAFYDRGDFVALFAEVKLPDMEIVEMARSTDRTDQIGRYLSQTGVVLLCNIRSVGLLACKPGYVRDVATPVPPAQRDLLDTVDLWPSEASLKRGTPVGREIFDALGELIERAVTEFAPIADPASLARILARQAKRAKADLPERFDAVAGLLEDYRTALGLAFDDKEGADFFRSSLIQTAFYGLFAGWTLWHRANDGQPFEWERMDRYLKIPFLGKLFYEFRHPDRLAELRLAPHLDRATETLGRVDRGAFFSRFTYAGLRPTEQESGVAAAITYFYEPFLEAFDPSLRKELGVWYTPPEIVRYQVRKVDRLLRDALGCRRGFADDRVVVLDPCCGTGAYLLEVMRCVGEDLRGRGEDAMLATELLAAASERIIGFEILTAPFVVAQLQLYLMLADAGAQFRAHKRPAVFLTNALTGWEGTEQVKLNFPELTEEHDLAEHVKRDAQIIVIFGNPPYNRFAGTALAEESDLVDHYKGIRRRAKRDRKGQIVTDSSGAPVLVQDGDSLLYARWGVRKQLLDDLYIRFFRLAEKRIGEVAEYGVVSFISNSSYLTGRSHPLMRESLLSNFNDIWIDNLNGDKYRTGKVIPDRVPGAGTSDQSIFTTDYDSRGIQVGTCISTLVKRPASPTPPDHAPIHYRDFWGRADKKRDALLESLHFDDWTTQQKEEATTRPEGPRDYEVIVASDETRWMFSPRDTNPGFEGWPALDELFPAAYQGVNPNRGLDGSVVDADRTALARRMQDYFTAASAAAVRGAHPVLMTPRARYNPDTLWKELRRRSAYSEERLVPYLVFPLDMRWVYYESEGKLLNERRPEYWDNLSANEFLVTVPQPRRASEQRPLLATTLVDLHVHDRGSVCFPRESASGTLLTARSANLQLRAWEKLKTDWGACGRSQG